MLKNGCKWMFLIMGTMIGAGYASGREIWQFFGQNSVLAILLFAFLFAVCCIVIMSISYEQKTADYVPVLETLLGKRLSAFYDIMILLYLFTTTVIMFAGGGAALEMFHIPYWTGMVMISFFVVILFFWDIRGILSMNALIIPILITLLVFVLGLFFFSQSSSAVFGIGTSENWPAAFTFTALNILPLVAVLAAVGKEIKHKGEIWIAGIGSALLLGAISLLYNESLLKVSDQMLVYEIPLFAILKHYPYYMVILMSVLLCSAIYTTAVSGMFGLISRLKTRLELPGWTLAVIMTCMMLPLATVGFSTLIAILYPIYGILNLYILASILIYPIARKYELS